MAKINLLHPDFREKKPVNRKHLFIRFAVIILTGLFVYAYLFFLVQYFEAKTTLANLDKQSNDLQVVMTKYNSLKKEKDKVTAEKAFLDGIYESRMVWSQFLLTVRKSAGPGLAISEFTVSDDNKFVVKGESLSLEAVGKLFLGLKKSAQVAEINLEFAGERLMPGKIAPVIQYQLNGTLGKGGGNSDAQAVK